MIKRTSLITAIRDNISANQKRFFAEIIGTFIVVVLATGSVVIDAKLNGSLGIPFVAFAPLWVLQLVSTCLAKSLWRI